MCAAALFNFHRLYDVVECAGQGSGAVWVGIRASVRVGFARLLGTLRHGLTLGAQLSGQLDRVLGVRARVRASARARVRVRVRVMERERERVTVTVTVTVREEP